MRQYSNTMTYSDTLCTRVLLCGHLILALLGYFLVLGYLQYSDTCWYSDTFSNRIYIYVCRCARLTALLICPLLPPAIISNLFRSSIPYFFSIIIIIQTYKLQTVAIIMWIQHAHREIITRPLACVSAGAQTGVTRWVGVGLCESRVTHLCGDRYKLSV